jgi:hypothetical protein
MNRSPRFPSRQASRQVRPLNKAMARPVAKLLIIFSAFAAVLVLSALILAMRSPGHPDPLPNPNGYDDFLKAAKSLENADYSKLRGEELRTVVNRNAEALKLARTGLERECRVRLEYRPDVPHLPNLASVKSLAQALVAEGRLAEVESRPGDAAQSYLTAIRLGQEATRGGLLIDALVGIAVEALGLTPLERLAPTLDAASCRKLATSLEDAESRRESVQAILDQEHTFARRTYGFRGQIARLLPASRKTEQAFASRAFAQRKRTQRLMIDMAARACLLDRGQSATNISELVPAYLKAIPRDPLTGTNASFIR